MHLTIALFGHEILTISTDTDPPEDTARDLSGGTLGGYLVDDGHTDWHMGFSNGRGDE